MKEHYQHFFPIRATISFDVFSTTITDELILFFLAIKIYRHTKHYVLHLMECQNLNKICLRTVDEVWIQ